jgi:hypothetical protein
MEYLRDLPGTPPTTLGPGDILFSATRNFRLVFQADGNLVLYTIDDTSLPAPLDPATLPTAISQARYSRVIWASYTNGSGAAACVMQDDGNLVLYSAIDIPVWSSETNGHPGAFLRCQDDGNLVILDGDTPIWASKTNVRPRGDSMGRKNPGGNSLDWGYSIQLNAYSLAPANLASAVQQYIIGVDDGDLVGLVQIWSADYQLHTPDTPVELGPAPSWPIDAGTRFQIKLSNDPLNNVSKVTFAVYDEQGLFTSGYIDVSQIGELVALAPIAAFQVDIVGLIDDQSATFSSGAGLITYGAEGEFVAAASASAGSEAPKGVTIESANTAYGFLPAGESTTFSQSFKIFS